MAEAPAEAETKSTTDVFGLSVTSTSAPCVEAINAYYEAVLAYQPLSALAIADKALEADGACPLARVLSADFAFCSGDTARASSLIAELTADATSATGEGWSWREQQYVKAWEQWIKDGDSAACFEVLLEVVSRHPADLFAVKRGQSMGVMLADGARIFRIVEVAAASSTPSPARFLYGLWVFGLVQSEEYEDAEEKARQGLALEAELGPDPWLDHGLARALYFQGDIQMDEAVEFMESRCSTWCKEKLHPFLYTSNWWHAALLYCEKRALEDSLRVLDERLWEEGDTAMRSDPQVQCSVFNLLWRMETRGERDRTRPRWEQVLSACQGVTLPASGDGAVPGSAQHSDLLLDLHIVRALCIGAATDASPLDAWLAAVAAHSAELAKKGEAVAERAEAYAALARLIADLYRTDQTEAGVAARHAKVRSELRSLQPRWASIGGSLEQRGVLLEALEGPVVCGEPEKNFDTIFF